MRRRCPLVLLLGAVVTAGEAFAISPATPEQLLCAHDTVVTATIVSTSPAACTVVADDDGRCPADPFASPTADVRIERVVAVRRSPRFAPIVLEEGSVYRVRLNPLPDPSDGGDGDGRRARPIGAKTRGASPAAVALAGHRLFLALDATTAGAPLLDGAAWAVGQERWIVQTLERRGGDGCPTLR